MDQNATRYAAALVSEADSRRARRGGERKPLLRIAGDGKEHLLADARSRLGAELKLTQTEQDELLPSGGQPRFANRVTWARVYLERAGLLESPRRGRFIISPRGREVLNAQPARIDVKFLAQYPEFREFQKAKRQTEEPTTQLTTPDVADAETPEEGVVSASWWICF